MHPLESTHGTRLVITIINIYSIIHRIMIYKGWNSNRGNTAVEAKQNSINYSHFYHTLVYV